MTGTSHGITGLQLDIKVAHLDTKLLSKALKTAEVGIHALLEQITPVWEACAQDNRDLNRCSTTMLIKQKDVGRTIGGGGKNLKQLQKLTRCRIELTSKGLAAISGPDVACIRNAVHRLHKQSRHLEQGRLYLAEIESTQAAGIHILVDSLYGLIPEPRAKTSLDAPILVRFVETREDGVLIFEYPSDPNLKSEQALNATPA